MADSEPITPGQVSFLLGVVPVFIAWMYAEFLEYKRSSLHSKVHSDNNLVELGEVKGKEEEVAVLLEGGGGGGGLPRSVSTKFYSSSIKTNLIRFLTMEDSFLIDNRATLRAMAEFGRTVKKTRSERTSSSINIAKHSNKHFLLFTNTKSNTLVASLQELFTLSNLTHS